MPYNRDIHHRRSLRAKTHDYTSGGAYFVTLCTPGRECLLDDPTIRDIITDVWNALPQQFSTVALDAFVIMPNHVHLIIWLGAQQTEHAAELPPNGRPRGVAGTRRLASLESPQTVTRPKLGDVIGAFKSLVTRAYRDRRDVHEMARPIRLWQRNYYEHVIRNERELVAVRQYIADNPMRWKSDMDNPQNIHRAVPAVEKDYLEDIAAGKVPE